ncbi:MULTISPECIES: EF-P beta-lysylation protein EpmB [unclassified Dyella]|uniref:EF-P beta-lysylation protein EpmB n=1 Tax=unclassified Dyella TaxID=2634549 RepID=UPI000C84C8E9|nr:MULTISPECIES: EF-P beta-lysylation protein EpmB [unclassified Dyella]MDR3448099.1 EF-P beta-lysylation protein EpmB [Dyella sp.]PMQ05552.1 L-lysine 2,3-aminomutase [Dyella sp. AD56]
MITASRAARLSPPGPDWRALWREAVTDPRELLDLVGLRHLADRLPVDDAGFAVRVPRGFVARMRQGDPSDPLLLQVLPQLAEHDVIPGFGTDAVGDMAARSAQGVLHKYEGRALLIASGSCAINCRYCFRRHFPYGDEMAAAGQWRKALEHVREDSSISELILSGGDPLSLATSKLAELTQGLAEIPHVTRLRIHTRLPVVLPERIDEAFGQWLAQLPLQKVVVLHANHANEFDTAVDSACARLRDAGATLLNQSVLLRGINDDADTLAALSERLFAAGVLPYYLHQLDRVQGAAHFEVDDERALALIEAVRHRLPGYLVPKLVREVGGEPSKRPV